MKESEASPLPTKFELNDTKGNARFIARPILVHGKPFLELAHTVKGATVEMQIRLTGKKGGDFAKWIGEKYTPWSESNRGQGER